MLHERIVCTCVRIGIVYTTHTHTHTSSKYAPSHTHTPSHTPSLPHREPLVPVRVRRPPPAARRHSNNSRPNPLPRPPSHPRVLMHDVSRMLLLLYMYVMYMYNKLCMYLQTCTCTCHKQPWISAKELITLVLIHICDDLYHGKPRSLSISPLPPPLSHSSPSRRLYPHHRSRCARRGRGCPAPLIPGHPDAAVQAKAGTDAPAAVARTTEAQDTAAGRKHTAGVEGRCLISAWLKTVYYSQGF